MSVRSFKRARARRLAREQRRLGRLKRRGALAAGAALSASALLAGNAQAATTYVVNSTADDGTGTCNPSPGECTLRDAITSANSDGTADTIDLTAVSGLITLDPGKGALAITDAGGLTITGPGSSTLSVSAGGASQVFTIATGNRTTPVEIDDLTITDGSTTNHGGAIDNDASDLTLNNDVVSGSTATGNDGGGIYTNAPLSLDGTTVSGNTASNAGGGIEASYYDVTITNSTITGNTAGDGGGIEGGKYVDITGSQITTNHAISGDGGGIEADGAPALGMHDTTVSGNTASDNAGGVDSVTKYGTTITGSTITGNTVANSSGVGGGLAIVGYAAVPGAGAKYNPVQVTDTTISGNHASGGAGIGVPLVVPGTPITISHSTLSGNTGGAHSIGGGVFVEGELYSPLKLIDSTVSGNTATQGGGVALSYGGTEPLTGTSDTGKQGSITLENSTIAKNAASGAHQGGGIYLGQYNTGSGYESGTVAMRSTIVAGNTAAGAPDDLARPSASTSGGFNTAFDLLQTPGMAPLLTNRHDILGKNPQLGSLANNGGPTKTMRPSPTSPVIAQGHAEDGLDTDQRGLPRTVPNPQLLKPAGGDGTDIGAVELAESAVAPTGFKASIHRQLITNGNPLLLVGSLTRVNCTVRVGALSACRITVPAYASGFVTTHASVRALNSKVRITADGRNALQNHPFGRIEPIRILGQTSRSGPRTVTGKVRLLASPSITLPLPAPGKPPSDRLKQQLQRVATILSGVKQITCTAYAGSGGSATEASSQANVACNQIKKDGFAGRVERVGKAGSERRLVISFTF